MSLSRIEMQTMDTVNTQLPRIAMALLQIETQLTRIADAMEKEEK